MTATVKQVQQSFESLLRRVEQGETIEIRKGRRRVAWLTGHPPASSTRADWASHFDWLRRQPPHDFDPVLTARADETHR